jgi:hypothetical protein
MRGLLCAAIFLVLSSPACSTARRTVKIANFVLVTPRNVKTAERYSVEDFSLGRASFLSLYVGNFPTYPRQKDLQVSETTLKGLKAKDVRFDNGTSRETLVELPARGWPKFVHFWYSNLSNQESEIADEIINSIRFSTRH